MGDGQEGLAGAGRTGAEHQVMAGQGFEIACLGLGLGADGASAAEGQAGPAGGGLALARGGDGHADIRLIDAQASVGPPADSLHRPLEDRQGLGVALDRNTTAGSLGQHVEGAFQQREIAVVGPGDGAQGAV